MPEGVRLAVDIGGTFTDIVLDVAGTRTTAKVLTTPAAPEEGVISGLMTALGEAGLAPSSLSLLLHGTTLATNAILERKGAKTAFVTTEGFRDVLEIGYESRFDQYDIMIEKPVPLVPRKLRLPVTERMDLAGGVLKPLDEAGVEALAAVLDENGIESVAIGYMHAYANPDHEHRTRDILAARLAAVSFSLSSEVCPEIREYERFTTTVANAYVRPLIASYLARLRDKLAKMGVACPVLLMTSGGGLTTLENAMQFPIRLVESGPAGGAILATKVSREMGLDRVISFDMGGTTAKICLIGDYRPQMAREFEVDRAARFTKGSGLPLRIPVIEMVEIGAGGGSIARLDSMNRVTIGPDSAGADPGPAAYGRGGERPTITDADVALGKIDPASFAGGKVSLYPEKAEASIMADIAEPLGVVEVTTAAYGVTEMVDETMANAARVHAVEQGKAVNEHSIIAFGGAAPLHAGRLAEKLHIDRIVVPTDAGVGSAVGFLEAPVAYEVVRSRNMRLSAFDPAGVNNVMAAMREEAEAVIRPAAPDADLAERRVAFMRYVGQGHEITVELPEEDFGNEHRNIIQAAFDAEYERHFRRTLPNAETEVLTWSLSLSAVTAPALAIDEVMDAVATNPIGLRRVYDVKAGEMHEVPMYRRDDLTPGCKFAGPGIIVEDQTSTYVPPGFGACIAGNGYIVLERNGESE
ncbi:MAG: hydantoinase/oxoprolinase family protein [Pseudomonadota bacterium]|nr:hydantoinase/oxoprolinase family protein [Pseudomonadota bacterium]